jgi:molybdopterin-guanine dinucleotide biosynthesis protein A
MGRSKVALFLDGIVAAARPVFDDVLAVQRHGGPAAELVETLFEPPHEERAPLFGVLTALEHALQHAEARAFILAVDYPLMTASALRVLAARVEASSSPLVVPVWNGKPQMLCGGYATSLASRMRDRISARRYDLRGLLDDAAGEIIAEDVLRAQIGGDALRNVNTAEELEEIHERLQSSR